MRASSETQVAAAAKAASLRVVTRPRLPAAADASVALAADPQCRRAFRMPIANPAA